MGNLNNQKQNYYEKFIVEENIERISNFKIRRNFWVYFFSFYLFCGAIPLIFTLVGFNFENPFGIGMFAWNVFLLFWLIYFCVRFNVLCNKYHPFKKKRYSYLFCVAPIILCIIFSLLPIWTTASISDGDEAFHVQFNPSYFLFIFIPLYLGNLIYCYYAFMKCFVKYVN